MAPTSNTKRSRFRMPEHAQAEPDDDWEARSEKLRHDHLSSELARADLSDNSEYENDPDGILADARWDKIDAMISANPAEVVRRWRQLWERRARGEKNKELKELTAHIEGFSELEEYMGPEDVDSSDEESMRMRTFRDLYRAGLCDVCELIVREDDFFLEREVYSTLGLHNAALC